MFPIIRCRNGLLTLLLFLLAVGGAKAQPEVTRTDKWTGNLELITGLGISHLENDGKVADTLVHSVVGLYLVVLNPCPDDI